MARVIIDMDEVMADTIAQFIAWFQREGYNVDPAALEGKSVQQMFPDYELARRFLYTPGFFRNKPVMKDAQKVVEALNQEHEVFIVSAAMEFPQSLIEKYEWLQEHFPFITWQQIAFCGSKALVHGDYMIDDHLKNLDYFNGEKLLFTSPHNTTIDKYTRVNTWRDVADVLLPGHQLFN
ncbi:5' nucleotidase, NT5C type [Filimonas effusa]|uniref:5'(3')-deoxyribonucleotidase n=1 Tax=Filimonas effusa TaxID=2508721 RepID=A0A4Q1D3P2_9BACT|nr:5'(3')-deoxyribonucleotidase [Filimonas effusa]RXK83005.1 5'(3')-deoxyribonucleotidase [Filimonas effusa]